MPIVAIQNRTGKLLIRATGANESYIVAGNTSVSNLMTSGEQSNSTNAGASFQVLGAHATKILWSSDGIITIKRGGSNQFILSGSGHMNLEEMGLAYSTNSNPSTANADNYAANLAITFSSANGTLLLEMRRTTQYWETDY